MPESNVTVDHNGNIHKVIDASDGSVVANYEYSPFGVLIGEWGPKKDVCPFRFQTKYYDHETQLYYFGLRYYDPASTKWLTRDPLGEAGGINLTAFCGNDPVNRYDALGLMPGLSVPFWIDPFVQNPVGPDDLRGVIAGVGMAVDEALQPGVQLANDTHCWHRGDILTFDIWY